MWGEGEGWEGVAVGTIWGKPLPIGFSRAHSKHQLQQQGGVVFPAHFLPGPDLREVYVRAHGLEQKLR